MERKENGEDCRRRHRRGQKLINEFDGIKNCGVCFRKLSMGMAGSCKSANAANTDLSIQKVTTNALFARVLIFNQEGMEANPIIPIFLPFGILARNVAGSWTIGV
jgi:hypothetical protein